MKKKKVFLIAGTVVLAWVVGLIAYVAFFTRVTPRVVKPVAELVPANVPGWESREIPLADTEAMNETVNQILQFDQYAYRHYKRGNVEVTVYVAYWRPGKITTTDAGVHNPDSCWVNSGWTRLDRKYGQETSVGPRKLKPLEYGLYEKTIQGKTDRLPVIFWHLVGGEVNRYQAQKQGWRDGLMGRFDRLPLVLEDLKKYGLNQRREQMFIRITANKSFDALFKDAEFAKLMDALAGLGVFEGQNW
ncbi:MAG: EpsI family protein [Puniceicoccales bacterium]|jgi:EpsI family protein|nr:EpsI family protein [Puniceicoccales bacterium]